MNHYYVYGYFFTKSGKPFYIGKGIDDRDREHLQPYRLNGGGYFHTKLRRIKNLGVGFEVIRLVEGLAEQQALDEEAVLIEWFGRQPEGILYNRSPGGPWIDAKCDLRKTRKEYSFCGDMLTKAEIIRDSRCLASKSVFKYRMRGGWDIEDAALTPPVKLYEYRGEQLTLRQLVALEQCDVGQDALGGRLGSGISVEEAVEAPPYELETHEFFGAELSLKSISNDSRCVVSDTSLRKRIATGKYTSAQHAATAPITTAPTYQFLGESLTRREILTHPRCLVSRHTLEDRLKAGWDLEKAATTPVYQAPTYEFNGQQLTLTELSELTECEVVRGTLVQNLQKGLPVDEATKLHPQEHQLHNFLGEKLTINEIARRPECQPSPRLLAKRALKPKYATVEEAALAPVRTHTKIYTYKGQRHSAREIATLASYPFSLETLKRRLDSCATVKEALCSPVRDWGR